MKKKFLILFMVLILIFSVACAQVQQRKGTSQNKASSMFDAGKVEKVKIIVNKTDVRSGGSSNFPSIGTLNKNDKIDVIGKLRNWYVVQLPDNKVGTVPEKDAKPIVEEDRDTEEQANAENKLTSQEQEMLRLVNEERAKNNVKPLIVDYELTKVARIKSQDMVENNYFSHYSPTYGSPFDMMKKFGIKYTTAGENIAANSTVRRAHDSLMGSSGHRKNILNPNFTHIGIGIKKGGASGYIFTQMFIGK